MPFHIGDKSGHFDANANRPNPQGSGFMGGGGFGGYQDPRYGNMNQNYCGGVPGNGVFGQDMYNQQRGPQDWNMGRRYRNGSDSDDSDHGRRNHGGWNQGRYGSHSHRRDHSGGSSSDEGRQNRQWR
ncbi:cercarial stage-specific protein Sj20H8 [Schistosoma japonicum]|uniref:Cercarial stage-specific protein Sj20H8 n=1 Tax=Schistosoma japonicum TaxID=6182 RepID=A7UD78_SCHJA|nr:cercarial stage-specific protein Sj20H8 [Schistosoma japonicum]KAH8868271.1 cercarial stage-specific protein Sj20H8 [Schistosoma japonicum]